MGPSALSITHPKAVNLIYGFGSPCTKNDFYDMTWPVQSLHSYRTKVAHDQRRRIWSPGFSDKALRGYEKRIRVYRQKLVNHISSMDGQPINVSNWSNWYSYDVMGDLAFGQSFEMLDSSTNHWVIQLLMDGVKQFKYLMPIWLFRLLPSIPGLTREWWRFTDFCNRRLVTRMQSKLEIPDISASLLDPLQAQLPTTEEFYHDTTATNLTTILYELAKRPDEVKKIRAELAPCSADLNGEYSHEKIANLQHMNGFINETLRLHPPIPSAIQRKTPPEGIDIDGIYVPGNMTVYCPQWVIGRSEVVYQNAKEFFPERWYKYPEMIKEKSAYAPFTIGPYICIGKPLALMNCSGGFTHVASVFVVMIRMLA